MLNTSGKNIFQKELTHNYKEMPEKSLNNNFNSRMGPLEKRRI